MSKQHVLQAITEYDDRGREEFLQLYGFAPSHEHTLVHEGRSYDARALLGLAHRFATGRLASSDEFDSGPEAAVAILRKRGFEVTEPAGVVRAAPARAPRAPQAPRAPRTPVARPSAVREAPERICPTCSMALPATGRCDNCD
ncbi:hypothetical protein ACTHAM_000734 [Cellulomonas soli]|uniref:hypothetical protein n=1 Tax=Cellulomonas soli TaxID=931535 RepID=UPI003F83AC21